jgi:uncharacterized membrane protein YkvA (DUF1232 family)
MRNGNKSNDRFRPLSERGWPKWAVYLIALVGLIYLLNPSFGVFELIPDNIPIVGNLDEGAAAIAFWHGLLELLSSKKKK